METQGTTMRRSGSKLKRLISNVARTSRDLKYRVSDELRKDYLCRLAMRGCRNLVEEYTQARLILE